EVIIERLGPPGDVPPTQKPVRHRAGLDRGGVEKELDVDPPLQRADVPRGLLALDDVVAGLAPALAGLGGVPPVAFEIERDAHVELLGAENVAVLRPQAWRGLHPGVRLAPARQLLLDVEL